MRQSQHSSLTALFKVIKEEKLEQFAVIKESKQISEDVSVEVYNLSRPFVSKLENKE